MRHSAMATRYESQICSLCMCVCVIQFFFSSDSAFIFIIYFSSQNVTFVCLAFHIYMHLVIINKYSLKLAETCRYCTTH